MVKKIVTIAAFIFAIISLFLLYKTINYTKPFNTEEFIDYTSGYEVDESVGDFSVYDFSNVDKDVERIYLDGYTIDFPNDMSNLENVRILTLENCKVSYEELGKIKELKYLEVLNINSCGINSMNIVYPKSLKVLNLQNNDIEKIEGLEGLKNLEELYLGFNDIDKVEGLDDLKNLQRLAINNNSIEKIEGLSELGRLHWLSLDNNDIKTVENFEGMPLTENRYILTDGMDEGWHGCPLLGESFEFMSGKDRLSPNYGCREKVSPLYSIDLTDNNLERITQESYDYITKYGIRYSADKELDELEKV